MTDIPRRDPPSICVDLRCLVCTAREQVRPWFKLTKMGVLRVEGGTSWHVDGAGATCPQCVTEKQRDAMPQAETWHEYDRRSIEIEREADDLPL